MALLESHRDHVVHDRETPRKGGFGGWILAGVVLAAAGTAYATNTGGMRERFESFVSSPSDSTTAGTRNAPPQPTGYREVATEVQPASPRVTRTEPPEGYIRPGPARVFDMSLAANCASAKNHRNQARWDSYGCPGHM